MSNKERFSYPIIETISILVARFTFFAVYMYDLMKIVEITKTENGGLPMSIPTAATDGKSIFINGEWFGKLSESERLFVLAHEILHGIFLHMPRTKLYADRGLGPDLKKFNPEKFNQAADYVINAILVNNSIGSMPSGDNQGLYNSKYTGDMLVDDVYCKLPDPPKDDSSGGGFDIHLPPDPNTPQPSEAEHQRAVQSALNTARLQGNLPGDFERLLGELVEPKKNWKEELRDVMYVTLGRDERSWRTIHRRKLVMAPHIIYPGTSGYSCGHVVIQIDTSGSVGNDEMSAFRSEVAAILTDVRPEKCTIIWCDTQCHVDDDVELEDIETLKPKGGGGTDMAAGFEEVQKNAWSPDIHLILTDGYTPYGSDPGYPVIWVTTQREGAPFGREIKLDVK